MGSNLLPTISTDPTKHPRGVCPFARKAKITELDLGNSTFEKLSAYDPKIVQMIIDYALHKDAIDSYAVGLPLPLIGTPITYQQFADHYRDVTGFFADMCYISEIVCHIAATRPGIEITPNLVRTVAEEFKKSPTFQTFLENKRKIQTDCILGQQTTATKGIIRDLEMVARSETGRFRGHTIYKGPWYGQHHPRYNPTPVLVFLHGSTLDIDGDKTIKVREEITARLEIDCKEYLSGLGVAEFLKVSQMLIELGEEDLMGMYGAEGLIPIPLHIDIGILRKMLQTGSKKDTFSIDTNHDMVCELKEGNVKVSVKTKEGKIIFEKEYNILNLLEDIEVSELGESICSGLYGKLYNLGIYIESLKSNKVLFNELNGYIQAGLKK